MPNTKQDQTCAFCDQRYETPVILPCQQSICLKHIRLLTIQDSIDCPLCNENHPIPKNGFPLVEKPTPDFNKLNELYTKYSQLKENPFVCVQAHFEDLKNSIEMFRVENIQIINGVFDQFIKDAENYEIESKNKISQFLNPYPSDDDSNSSDYLRRKIDKLVIDSQAGEYISNETLKLEKKIEKKIAEFKESIVLKNPVVFSGKKLEKPDLGRFERKKLQKDASLPGLLEDERPGNLYIALKDSDKSNPDNLEFNKGDKIVVKERNGNQWNGQSKRTDKTGFVNPESIAEVYEDDWFYGNIERNDATNYLGKSSNKCGAFLIRFSSNFTDNQVYSLSVKGKDENIKHYKILRYVTSDGRYEYKSPGDRCKFKSLKDFVANYSRKSNGLCTELTHACLKN